MRLVIAFLFPMLAFTQAVPETLSLQQALRIAAESRAETSAADDFIAAQSGAVRQASRAPNPTLSVQTENWRGGREFSASTDVETLVFVSQQIELSGKRRLRTEAAEADQRIAEAEREVLRWQIEGQVTQAWWRVFLLQQEVELIQESLASAQELVRYQEARWREGAAPEIDLIKVRVELEKERRRLAEFQITEVTAKHQLLAEMGAQRSTDFRLLNISEALEPPLDAAVAAALDRRPDLKLLRSFTEREEARASLQRAQTTPDITPYIGYKHTGGLSTLIGGISIPLKLRDRNGGAIAQAVALANRQRQLVRALEMRVRSEVESAITARESRLEILSSLQEGLLADATQSYEIALAAYRESGVDLLYVIDAQRTLNEAKLLRLQAEIDYQQSRADVLQVAAINGGVE